MPKEFDVIVIGAGIVGLATAYRLKESQPRLKVAICEKETEICQHQTGHNSGVIHSGIYYKPGSLKALNCARGWQQLVDFCELHGIDYELCGKVIVATQPSELPQLEKILQRGTANGLKGLEKIGPEATREIEPHVNVVAAIKVPQAGIIYYPDVARKLLRLFEDKGGQLFLSNKVTELEVRKDLLTVVTPRQTLTTKLLINCAGLYSDKVANMTGQQVNFQILPFRGEYYELKKEKEYLVNHLIYPVPNPAFPFMGVHFTPMIKGGIEAGPNAVLAFRREGYSRWDFQWKEFWETVRYPGFQKLARKYWQVEIGELQRSFSKKAFVRALRHLISDVNYEDLVRGGAGVRAQACGPNGALIDDFLLLESARVINVCNAPSPAATSSLSIGQTIAEKALERFR